MEVIVTLVIGVIVAVLTNLISASLKNYFERKSKTVEVLFDYGKQNRTIKLYAGDSNADVSERIEATIESFRESQIVSQWLASHYQRILTKAELESFVPNDQTPDSFRAAILKYIKLLVESLKNDMYITPRSLGITFHVNNPYPYIQALQSLKAEIGQEVDKHQDLSETQLRQMNHFIEQLICNIDDESFS